MIAFSLIFVKLLILSNGDSLKEVSHSLILETVYNNGSRLCIIIRRGQFLTIANNGFCTIFFKLSRGVRQGGCPLSPYLFIVGAEM